MGRLYQPGTDYISRDMKNWEEHDYMGGRWYVTGEKDERESKNEE